MSLLAGKKAVVFGIANERSIAYGIAKALSEHGAELGLTYASEVLEKRVTPIAAELKAAFCEKCDVADDSAMDRVFETVKEKFGTFDILVHSVAYAPKECLTGKYLETSRDAFFTTMNISVYSLLALAKRAEPLFNDNGSVITLTYYGGEKYVEHYNVMGVAKAALDATVRYLSVDLGTEKGVRVNAISAGPIKTLASSGISGFRSMLSSFELASPLRRSVSIDDCGGAAVYLASDLSKNVTGEILHVDTGLNIVGLMPKHDAD